MLHSHVFVFTLKGSGIIDFRYDPPTTYTMYFVWSLAMTLTGLDNFLRALTVNRDSMNRELSQGFSLPAVPFSHPPSCSFLFMFFVDC